MAQWLGVFGLITQRPKGPWIETRLRYVCAQSEVASPSAAGCCGFCGVCLLVLWCCVLVGFVVLCVCRVCGFLWVVCLLVVTVKDKIFFLLLHWNNIGKVLV